ncbi:MAG: PAS domain-containing protein [Alphaproteobacteria bacterium]|nr:PAS domain-containing protein [Alphaproteobacteria bacterium]
MTHPIGDPGLAGLYRYWCGKKRGDALPRRADLDPTELPGTLWPTLMLLDVVRPPSSRPSAAETAGDAAQRDGNVRFRYRLVGTAFTHAFARDPTHEFVDEALPTRAGYRDYVVNLCLEVVRIRKPIYSENLFALDGQPMPMVTKRLSLPLASDGGTVDMVLASHAYDYDHRPLEGYMSLNTGFRELKRVTLEG